MAIRAGFVGLGYIGKLMALQLPKAGLETTVFDIVAAPVQELAAAGAKPARSPREVAAASDARTRSPSRARPAWRCPARRSCRSSWRASTPSKTRSAARSSCRDSVRTLS